MCAALIAISSLRRLERLGLLGKPSPVPPVTRYVTLNKLLNLCIIQHSSGFT